VGPQTLRIGALYWHNVNARYRAKQPLRALERRGHEVLRVPDPYGEDDLRALERCDVFQIHRICHPSWLEHVARLQRAGVAVVYDNDDSFAEPPTSATGYDRVGPDYYREIHRASVAMAKRADLMTTPSQGLAALYREEGVARCEIVENYLDAAFVARRPPRRRRSLTIGWVAGVEHRDDLRALALDDVLRAILDAHPHVRVESIGLNLGLAHARYRHRPPIPYEALSWRIRHFEIALAPLVDTPLNRARSNVKVKEYAASGVPWLASDYGPYRGLGKDQGGHLVPDDGRHEALDALVTDRDERRRLADAALAWARTQTLDDGAARWEAIFAQARNLRADTTVF
jgi:glycosyltransferase involved in cell wall biosynthesis